MNQLLKYFIKPQQSTCTALLRNKQIVYWNRLGGLERDQDILDKDSISVGWENMIIY